MPDNTPPAVKATLEGTIPYPLVGPALWDRLRDLSLQAEAVTGGWPVSPSEGALRDDVEVFAKTVFDDPGILWNAGTTAPIEVTGSQLKDRFLVIEGGENSTKFAVSRNPYPGEITASMMGGIGPMCMLHTNCFASMFKHERLAQPTVVEVTE